MKIIKKTIILIFCIFSVLCQINETTNAYSNDEIASIIELKTVKNDGVPTKYDIEIESEDLQSNVEFPVIQASMDYVLFGNDEFSNIDFLAYSSALFLSNLTSV